MENEELHETAQSATQAIEKYFEINDIEEENAVLDVQLDYCKGSPEKYCIDYTVRDENGERFFTPTYTFDDQKEASDAYIDHLESIRTEFEEVEKRLMDPSIVTEAGRYGGNILI